MTRKQLLLLLALLATAVVLVGLALRNPRPPWLPSDPQHAGFSNADDCLTCHGPGGPSPQSPAHPVGRDCTRCHAHRGTF